MAIHGNRSGLMFKLCELVPTYEFPGKDQLFATRQVSRLSSSELTASAAP
jgi:hypothetical protein